MRAVFLSDNLRDHLTFLNQAVSPRATLPILVNFLIETKKGKVVFSATDLEIGATAETTASIEEEGAVTAPAKTLSDLLSSLPGDKVTLEAKNGRLNVSSKKARASLAVTPPDDFPKLFEEKGDEVALVSRETIEKELRSVVFAASQDLSRPVFSGVLIKPEKEGLLLVATDAHRLSKRITKSLKTKKDSLKEPIIVSARAIRALLSGKGGEEISVFVSKKNNQVVFTSGERTLVGRLLEGEFPQYEKIIPQDFSVKVEFDRSEMEEALKISSIFARESANIVRFAIGKDKITVSSSGELGEQSNDVEAKVNGEENEIAFNAGYVLDLLANIDSERVSFEMSGPLNPGVFRTEDPSFLHLIMPIRVKDERA
jgi:DNA polymerase III subunit beta